jgi:hypothetical protein
VSRHIEELAELYALGSLGSRESAAVERHVRTCIECADRIRDAEATIAFISDLEEHHQPPRAAARSFPVRLAGARAAQKRSSLKVIVTVLVGGLLFLMARFAFLGREAAPAPANVAPHIRVASVALVPMRAETAFPSRRGNPLSPRR